jgi:para-aminobenzoate synthetase component 2
MILIIDNYDSFVFNLARYVEELGYSYEVYRNDKISLAEVATKNPSHIILSPGPCTPNEAGICLSLIESFMDKIPILGVCLGHQALAQACGAKIVRASKPMHGKADDIVHDGSRLMQGLPNPLKVGRYHSLIVDPSSVPDVLHVTAYSSSGEIMAIEHRQFPAFGVQFHPESVLTECGYEILNRFLGIRQTCRKKTQNIECFSSGGLYEYS